MTKNASYCPDGFVDSTSSSGDILPGSWRSSVDNEITSFNNLRPFRGSRYQQDAISMLNSLKEYVNSPLGKLDWQLDHVRRT